MCLGHSESLGHASDCNENLDKVLRLGHELGPNENMHKTLDTSNDLGNPNAQ